MKLGRHNGSGFRLPLLTDDMGYIIMGKFRTDYFGYE